MRHKQAKLSKSELCAGHISMEQTANSGQVFLWNRLDGVWFGVNGEDVIGATKDKMSSLYGKEERFFRLDDDFGEITKTFHDRIVKKAINNAAGLRLLRQDPFQCYISFIASSNSSIQNIRNSLEKVCKKFGRRVNFDGRRFCLFPSPKKLANATESELLECGLGYRARFVKRASQDIVNGKIDLESLRKTDYNTARDSLCGVFGIGDKVADCILLFSLDKLEAFPLDRWMLRVLEKYYPGVFSFEGKTLTSKKYEKMHDDILEYFGPYAGYAQQFLFKMERDLNQKKWL